MRITKKDTLYMMMALSAARGARAAGDYAFGAVLANNSTPMFRVYENEGLRDADPTSHVETHAISKLAREFGMRNLKEFTLYSSCQLCAMCTLAAYWANIRRVVYSISQEDLKQYGLKHGTDRLKYRACPIMGSKQSSDILRSLRRHGMVFTQLMKDEGLKMLHEQSSRNI